MNIATSIHKQIAAPQKCFHCGEDCVDDNIVLEEKDFCCEGCLIVYQLLIDNNLDAYYKLEKTPGSTINKDQNYQQYAYLDLKEAKEQLFDFYENGLAKITFAIPKIHCSSCVYLLENLPKLHHGVQSVMVDFIKREASVTFYESTSEQSPERLTISLRKLVELLVRIGYTPDLSQRKNNNSKRIYSNSNLGFKIGLAGFCFGNIMMLSFPEYFSIDEFALKEYEPFFGGLNLLLSLPVLLYCAQDYFISAWGNLKQRMIGIDVPIVLGIIAFFGRSAYEILSQTGAGYMDSFAGLIFFLLVGKWYQSKTYQALSFERDYTSYFPIATTQIEEDKTEKQVLIQNLEEGAIIKIRNQEIIPADSQLLSANASIDYSFVTGESNAISKLEGDKIFAGGRQLGGSILLKITKKVNQSYFTQLWNQRVFEKEKTVVLSKTVDTISRYFTIAILMIAFSTLTYWLLVDSSLAVMAFSSVLIIACPCALALTAPFTFGNTLRLLGREGLYLKNALTVEQLSGITDIIFDKTGTLTTTNATDISFVGTPLSEDLLLMVQSTVQHSTHPLSQMLFAQFDNNKNLLEVNYYKEYEGKGLEATIQGKILRVGSASFVGLETVSKEVLASQVYICYNNQQLGYFNIKKQYRKDLEKVLLNLGIDFNLHLLSGDNDSEKAQLEHLFKGIDNMRFYQAPIDKLNYVKTLQEEGKKVLMVGDGLNDAGALQQAEVGIAISNDVYSFSPASDGILDAKKFEFLDRYIAISKASLKIVKASFKLSLMYNSFGLYFAVQALLTPLIAAVLMPMSSITIISFVTLASTLTVRHYINKVE